ncbi:hypothetical protein HPB47_006867, partial [Ixodes persulcatus]
VSSKSHGRLPQALGLHWEHVYEDPQGQDKGTPGARAREAGVRNRRTAWEAEEERAAPAGNGGALGGARVRPGTPGEGRDEGHRQGPRPVTLAARTLFLGVFQVQSDGAVQVGFQVSPSNPLSNTTFGKRSMTSAAGPPVTSIRTLSSKRRFSPGARRTRSVLFEQKPKLQPRIRAVTTSGLVPVLAAYIRMSAGLSTALVVTSVTEPWRLESKGQKLAWGFPERKLSPKYRLPVRSFSKMGFSRGFAWFSSR